MQIPYGRQNISDADIEAVVQVLKSDFLTQGPVVSQFENKVADYAKAQFAVASNSGTSALHIACAALELSPGDSLWTSATTFVASANCGRYCGADIDFVDIDPATYNMSITALEQKLKDAKARNKLPQIVIPVHLCGQSCDMEALWKLGQEYGFRIIEDASHALGATYKGSPVGACRYSDITVFSFHPVKIITSAEGGMSLTNSEELAEKMRRLRTHGITNSTKDMVPRVKTELWNYQQVELGFNYRMNDLEAALGLSQMTNLDEFIKTRHEIADRYNARLSPTRFTLPKQLKGTYSSYHLYPIRLRSEFHLSQKELYKSLRAEGIMVNLHYIPVYRHPYYEQLGFKSNYCPEAERYHRDAISLPIFPGLTSEQQEFVISTLNSI